MQLYGKSTLYSCIDKTYVSSLPEVFALLFSLFVSVLGSVYPHPYYGWACDSFCVPMFWMLHHTDYIWMVWHQYAVSYVPWVFLLWQMASYTSGSERPSHLKIEISGEYDDIIKHYCQLLQLQLSRSSLLRQKVRNVMWVHIHSVQVFTYRLFSVGFNLRILLIAYFGP